MKIESLKATSYKASGHMLSAAVQAENHLQVTNALIGKENIRIYTDNEDEEMLVEEMEGYRYLSAITQVNEGTFEVVLTSEAPTPQSIRDRIVAEIESYDKSDAVNSFTLAGRQMWLDKDTRVGLVNSINIEKSAGKETTSLWFDTVQYEIPIDAALQMLAALELYALDCYNITQAHIASVKLLDDMGTLEAYDYTAGYPDKLVFNL